MSQRVTMFGLALAALLAASGAAGALEPGEPVDVGALPAVAGGQVALVRKGEVSVLVFVRPNHGHCLDTLRDLAAREGQHAGVHWVAIVPGDTAPADARALASTAGIRMPVVLDAGDTVYGRLRVKLHPTIFVVGRDGRLVASEPFREINYGDRLTALVRFALGEISQGALTEAEEPTRSDTHTEAGAAKSQLRYAQRLLDMGDLDQALAEVQKSLGVAPSGGAYLLQGKILARQGKCKDALRAFAAARRLDPKSEAGAAESNCRS